MAKQRSQIAQESQPELKVQRVMSNVREERCRIDLLDYLSKLHRHNQDQNVIAYVAESEDFFSGIGYTRTLAPSVFLICVRRMPDSKKYEMWQARYDKCGDSWSTSGFLSDNPHPRNRPQKQFRSGDLEYRAFEHLLKSACEARK